MRTIGVDWTFLRRKFLRGFWIANTLGICLLDPDSVTPKLDVLTQAKVRQYFIFAVVGEIHTHINTLLTHQAIT